MELPQPATCTEMYLAAILDELKGLRKDLTAPVVVNKEIRVREPAPTVEDTAGKLKRR